jgi:hypothetical protein
VKNGIFDPPILFLEFAELLKTYLESKEVVEVIPVCLDKSCEFEQKKARITGMRKYPCHGRGSKKQIDLLASNYPKKLNILAIGSLLEDTKLTCMLGCQMWPPWLIY